MKLQQSYFNWASDESVVFRPELVDFKNFNVIKTRIQEDSHTGIANTAIRALDMLGDDSESVLENHVVTRMFQLLIQNSSNTVPTKENKIVDKQLMQRTIALNRLAFFARGSKAPGKI